MEYASIYNQECDSDSKYNNTQYIKYVGYSSDICNSNYIDEFGNVKSTCSQSSCVDQFFSKSNVKKISSKITELLMGVDKNNRPIIVPDKTIYSVMSQVNDNFRPETGDIYARYNIPTKGSGNMVQKMIDIVINVITTDVKNNLQMDQCNEKLTIWTTVLGDFNEHGLRQHPPIKLRERRPQPMAFFMNY
jgi:hypothetical protein